VGGWDQIGNGERLTIAKVAGFEIVITVDQNIRYQQNLSGRCLSLVVVWTPAAQLPRNIGQQRLDPGQPRGMIGLGVGDTHDRQLVAVLADGEIGNSPLDRAQPGLHGRETMTGLALQ
jgi:hypothetical protein